MVRRSLWLSKAKAKDVASNVYTGLFVGERIVLFGLRPKPDVSFSCTSASSMYTTYTSALRCFYRFSFSLGRLVEAMPRAFLSLRLLLVKASLAIVLLLSGQPSVELVSLSYIRLFRMASGLSFVDDRPFIAAYEYMAVLGVLTNTFLSVIVMPLTVGL